MKNRPGRGRWIVLILLGGGVLYAFRYELNFLRNLAWMLLRGQPAEGFPPLPEALHMVLLLAWNLCVLLGFTGLLLYWMAGALHPARNPSESYWLLNRLARFLLGQRRPLMIVREGELPKEAGQSRVALVDLNSALVIEKQRARRLRRQRSVEKSSAAGAALPPLARVCGAGLVFLGRGESLRGVVSLRKQFRSLANTPGQTSDGIEVRTSISTLFSLGQPASVVQVAYLGDPLAENLRVVQIEAKTRKIKAIHDELDEQDKEEIHRFAQGFIYYVEPNSLLALNERASDLPPYELDEQRILAAVYSQARNVNDGQPDSSWADLPVMVAAEIFRNMLSRLSYDALYLPENPSEFPLHTEIKPAFQRRVQYMGVMSYQFILRTNGEPPEVNQRVDHRQFRIAAVQPWRGSKILRDRGIKIIQAGFSELTPTDPQVKQQLLDFWRARWQRQADLIRADLDLEAMRLRSRARAEKQREMSGQISAILQSSNYSDEALTLRVFQALEEAAADPHTGQLLPEETLQFLRRLRIWLSPDEAPHPALLQDQMSQDEE